MAAGFLAVLLAEPDAAHAQAAGARRMAMGGVILSDGGEGAAHNVAYGAVPRRGGSTSLPLPLGLVQLAIDPPVFDPEDPDFNFFEVADRILNPPYNLQLVEPEPPSSDVVVEIGRDRLVIDLEDLQRALPERTIRNGGRVRSPEFAFRFGPAFVGLGPLYEVDHELILEDRFHRALTEAEPFVPNTRYGAVSDARAQALLALQGGVALPVVPALGGDPYTSVAPALYGGVRLKYLRGVAWFDAVNDLGFTTADTLFGSDPVDVDYAGVMRATGDDDLFSGSGFGLDLGAVLFVNRFEIGVGLNDVVHEVRWTADVDTFRLDPLTNDVEKIPGPQDVRFDGEYPVSWLVTVAYRPPGWTLAATVVKSAHTESWHAGAERWVGPWALRGGFFLDPRRNLQGATGAGVRLGPVGLDLALATHSRSLTEERGLEMGLSLAFYGGGR